MNDLALSSMRCRHPATSALPGEVRRKCTLTMEEEALHWHSARHVAGLPNVSSQWAGEPNKLTFMHCFYSQHVGAMHVENISTSSSSASYTYVTMWKAGSSFIHQNLGASFNSSQVIGVRHPQTKGAVHGTVFTFAREPLSRFFSGATEVAWRTRLDGCTQRAATSKCPTRKQTAQEWRARVGDMAVSMARNTNQSCVWRSSGAEVDVLPPPRYAEQLLQAILNVDSDWAGFKVSHIAHLLPQVGAVNGGGWPLQFIGHTEQFAEDWASLRGRVPGGLPRFEDLDRTLGMHPTTDDPLGTKAALVALLQQQPRLRHAICRLLQPDYKCFGYDESQCVSALQKRGRLLPGSTNQQI
mmetsp:Transcript_28929/g.48038  ORF Transcript_28929/g.48038 Transcript_28929/m.48038 type:complete len:355 (+) Transcript_28929:332-1396(+)